MWLTIIRFAVVWQLSGSGGTSTTVGTVQVQYGFSGHRMGLGGGGGCM